MTVYFLLEYLPTYPFAEILLIVCGGYVLTCSSSYIYGWMCVCIYVNTHVPGSTYEGQSSTCRSMFSLSTICVVESNFLYQIWWQVALPTEPPCSSLWVLEVSVSRASRTWLKLNGLQETCVHPLTIPGLCLTPVVNK